MRPIVWMTLMCGYLLGCIGDQRQLRQSVGVGPGPGCASTLDCMCKNGSEAACAQLGRSKATRPPRPEQPKPPGPGPVPPLVKSEEPATNKIHASEKDIKDRCTDYYDKCVAAGGESLPGHASGYTRCGSCLDYCTTHGFWPEALYTWNGVRLSCPGH
jgi:hypothetical protein